MSDTPETDAVAYHVLDANDEHPQGIRYAVDGSHVCPDFARRLERERNEVREENARLREALGDCASHLEGWHTMEALENARKLLTP